MKYLPYIILSSLVVMAGCASDPASVNSNVGTTEIQKQNENTEVIVANDDTNAEANTNVASNVSSDEVGDTSDLALSEVEGWLTYTNEEYGFSVKYPSNYSFDESSEGVNFINLESDSSVANQENIKFYVQSYSEAPDKQGEAYALLSTKSELAELKNEMIQNADKIVNGEAVNIYNSYDVPGDAFYRGASFFANQDYVRVSMVVMPIDIIHSSHPFNDETREWSKEIVQQLNEGQLISENDEVRIQIFNEMINTLKVL